MSSGNIDMCVARRMKSVTADLGIIFLIPVSVFFVHKLLLVYRKFYYEKEDHKNDDEQVMTADTNKYNVSRVLVDNMLGGEIMKRLSILDQAHFRAVCKDWLVIHRNYTTIKSLPWYAQYDRQLPVVSNKLEFRLYDPLSTPNLVSTQYISLTKLGIPSPCRYEHTWAIAKNNWFFICIRRPKLLYKMQRYFLAYSPFSKQLIKLPTFDSPSGPLFRGTFTTVPDSSNCVFFLLKVPIVKKFVFVTYRKGDSGWTFVKFDKVDGFASCDCELVFCCGIMYIVSPYGQLASYNIVDGRFRYENLGRDENFNINYKSLRRYRVFELNGELMMLYTGSEKIKHNTSQGKQCLKQFDRSNKVWIPVTTLGDRTLFLGQGILSVAVINREEMRYNRILSNKIYIFFDDGCIIYSLENGDLVQFKSILKDGCGELPEYNCGITSTGVKIYHHLKPPNGLC